MDPTTPSLPWVPGLRLALAFLTRLPVGKAPLPPVPVAAAMRCFPLAGAVVGTIGGTIFTIAQPLVPGLAAAALAIGATLLATGALHEDGLADCADGIGGGRDVAAKLAIMRDSRIGTYGAAALTVMLTIRAGTLTTLAPLAGFLSLVAAHALAQTVIPATLRALKPARADGLGAGAGIPDGPALTWAMGLGAAIALVTLPVGAALLAMAGAMAGGTAMALLAKARLGGFTGDVLGATQQCALTGALLAIQAAS